MVEIVFDEKNNVGIAAFVLGVAGRALVVAGLRMESVIPVGRVDVRGDVLVTVHAKFSLRRLVKHCVA